MNWKDIGTRLANSAPLLGAALGGPAGAAAGSLIAATLGTSNNPDEVAAALTADPTAMVRIKEIEANAKVELQKLVIQGEANRLQYESTMYQAEAADRDSARNLAAKQPRDLVRPALTFTMIGGSLFIVVAVLVGVALDAIKDPNAALTVGMVIGSWLTMTKETMGFWFGMTKESQKQNQIVTDFAVAPGSVSKPDPLTKQQ
jgi:hypothetical protein